MNFEQFFARLKTAFNALSGKQLGTLAVAFVLVVGLTIGSAYWLNQPTYGVLFADMEPEAASTMASKLKTAKVDYVLDQGGRTIRVPLARVDELRLQFASDGITGMARPGFDLFDGVSFGVTDFQEHVNYRRALEGELARTIGTISEVAGARVHIALAQPSLFTRSEQPTKASVILKLKGNRALPPSTITAITGLVAASVEQLRPEHVVIVDNYGRPLSKPSQEDDGSDGAPVERQQRIEHDLTSRVVALLEPIVGVGHVRVNVSAKLNTGSEEQTEERFEPNPILRSQKTIATQSGMPLVAQGVAGAAANLPPDPARPAPAAAATTPVPGATANNHHEESLNYELSKVTRHSLQPRGDIKRLSVAVLVDDVRQPSAVQNGEPASAAVKPRTQEDLQKIQGLVSAAVGFDSERGDQITVENIAFEETPVQEVAPGPGAWQQYGPQAFEALRIVGIIVIGGLAIFLVIRPMVRSSLSMTPAPRGALAPAPTVGAVPGMPRTVQDLEAEMDAQMSPDALKMPMMTRRMAALTQKEPESAARLLRTWLNQE